MPKKDPHVTGAIRHDWKTIKHDYVTTPGTSLKKIGQKYGVNTNTMYERSRKEGWYKERKRYQEQVVERAIAKTANIQAKELAKEAGFLELMKGHVDRMMKDQEQFQRQLLINPVTGETEEKVTAKFDSRAMKESMQVLKMMEEMTRSLYNIQKAEALQKAQIERERLELEKERLQLEKERNALRSGNMDDDGNAYGVVIMPEVLKDE